ncbi:DUF3303 domain-containing protein [Pseudomonas sp. TWI929]|uniref:DUF3303 domain-containing protein n=1 Tax=Pseudomonas sp. TWI929 TaxID=3136795 RepID=UPI00320B6298
MLFIIHWTITPENRNAVLARFAKTGGAPPADVKLHGRWYAVGQLLGFAVAESDRLDPVLQWSLEWSDLMHMHVYPAMVDEQAAPLLLAALNNKAA